MHHGLVDVAVVAEPARGRRVQAGHPLGLLQLQVAARCRGEQVVEPEPPARLVARDQEQVAAFELVEESRGVARTGQVVGQGCREAVQDGHRPDELANLVTEAGEHLLGQVVTDEAVAFADLADELVRVGPTCHRQRGEVQPRGPSLGALHQVPDRAAGQAHLLDGQQGRGLLDGEGQVGSAYLRESAGGPEPGDPQPGIGAGENHEVRLLGQVLDEELHLACGSRRPAGSGSRRGG